MDRCRETLWCSFPWNQSCLLPRVELYCWLSAGETRWMLRSHFRALPNRCHVQNSCMWAKTQWMHYHLSVISIDGKNLIVLMWQPAGVDQILTGERDRSVSVFPGLSPILRRGRVIRVFECLKDQRRLWCLCCPPSSSNLQNHPVLNRRPLLCFIPQRWKKWRKNVPPGLLQSVP